MQRCMVENFKGEHRVHTDMRLRQQGRAHIDIQKRDGAELRTCVRHTECVCALEGGGVCIANTVNNNFFHSCCESVRTKKKKEKKKQLAGCQEKLGGFRSPVRSLQG